MQPKQAPAATPGSGPPGLHAGSEHTFAEVQTSCTHPAYLASPGKARDEGMSLKIPVHIILS